MPSPGPNPVARVLRPLVVRDVAEVQHAVPGRLRLRLLRRDAPCVQAVVAALEEIAGVRDVRASGTNSVTVQYNARSLASDDLLSVPLPPLPLPPARVDASMEIAAAPERVWAVLTPEEGPPWRPPGGVRVAPLPGEPPAWAVEVAVGGWRLPHRMDLVERTPPTALELVVSGKLNAVARYDLTSLPGDRCGLTQRLWFEIAGSPAEALIGGAIVEALARALAPGQMEAARRAAEGYPPPRPGGRAPLL